VKQDLRAAAGEEAGSLGNHRQAVKLERQSPKNHQVSIAVVIVEELRNPGTVVAAASWAVLRNPRTAADHLGMGIPRIIAVAAVEEEHNHTIINFGIHSLAITTEEDNRRNRIRPENAEIKA